MTRVLAGLSILSLLLLGGWGVWAGVRSAPSVAGTPVPARPMRTAPGGPTLFPAEGQWSLIVRHRHSCPHCLTQLDALERAVDRLSGIRLYFLTAEDSVRQGVAAARWPVLARRGAWGTVSPQVAAATFETSLTPALILVNPAGVLVARWVGRTSVAQILDAARGVGPVAPTPSRSCARTAEAPRAVDPGCRGRRDAG